MQKKSGQSACMVYRGGKGFTEPKPPVAEAASSIVLSLPSSSVWHALGRREFWWVFVKL